MGAHTHIHTYTLNGRLPLRVIEHIYIHHIYTPLRVSARDPRCARATSFLSGTMLRRLAPAALGACDAWRLRRLAPATLGAALGAIFCLGWPLEASRGPNESKSVFSGCPQSDIIVIDHFWGRWTLPTCSNMPYTTSIPTIVCLVWPLEASKGPKRPKWAQMSVFGTFPE